MTEAFAMQKLLSFFSTKNIGVFEILTFEIITKMLTNHVVSFEQPGPVFYVMGKALSGELSCMGTGLVGWEVSLVMKLFNWSLDLLEMLAVASGLQGRCWIFCPSIS